MCSNSDKKVLNCIFNPLLPIDENDEDLNEYIETIDTPEEEIAKNLELEAINSANSSDIEKALELFNKAIITAPKRASGYNNRAQVLRIKGNIEEALLDLNRAISLSGGKGYVSRQAYCQRGLIKLIKKEEKEAMDDLKNAAQLGNVFAKSFVAQMNPYAALCNKMLKDMIEKVRIGVQDEN